MPGSAVGAGRAVTLGANEPRFAFSVGATAGALLRDVLVALDRAEVV